ncbi:endonuclease YncB(thermonuclease family) [Ochrobactrum daejeonense]|uniref:Endonuclease YncB(Thermonuclease family) n=2 Tax=Brucella daejeonensis TaxID=659015 RepID=A0A7W9AW05_9HYPH|nr:endonuclease YncB(thermonuclease family) [Brucella daejeonensis]
MNGTVYVIDGDTVIMDKTHIRLKGMDAPEMEQQCERAGRNYDCGREARNILRAKIGKSAIRCDKEGRDQYMRELSRCYLGETELNRWMVEQGWAVSYGDYQHEESNARRNRRGIWDGRFEQPSLWRKEHRNQEDDRMLHHTQQNDVIGSAIIYIREHIQALLGTIVPRN